MDTDTGNLKRFCRTSGGMSMPPVEAPERITNPRANPIMIPAKMAQSMGSVVNTKSPARAVRRSRMNRY